MPLRFLRHLLGGSARWRGEAGRRGSARGKEDKGIRLHRHRGTKAANSSRLSGTIRGCGFDRDSAMEWTVWKVLGHLEGTERHVNQDYRQIRRRRKSGIGSVISVPGGQKECRDWHSLLSFSTEVKPWAKLK